MIKIELQKEPIDVAACYQQLKNPNYGGIVSFVGTIREWTGDIQTTRIEYTAYEEMARKEMEKLALEVEKTGASVVIVHRIGTLEIMDEAVFIGVACRHRKAAFASCEYLINELKDKVPIWKKEIDKDKIRWGGSKEDDTND